MSKKMEFKENVDYVPNWNVEYVDTTGCQYTTIPLRSLDKSVWAKYVKNRRYPGNILIEAINRKRTSEEIFKSAECKISYTSREEEIQLPADEQCDRILSLIDWRIALPYQDEIEDAIDKAIISSYHRRYPAFDKNVRLEVYANSEKSYVNGKFNVPIEKDTGVTSVCITGEPGCGKSNAVTDTLHHRVQSIKHPDDTGSITRQIVYLFVNCPPNSNFKRLFRNIGRAMDDALGNADPVFKREFEKRKNDIGACFDLLHDYILLYNIGIIVIDEIQNIRVNTKTDSNLEALMFLSNETDVGYVMIGLDEFLKKLNKVDPSMMKIIRRWIHIPADKYCTDRETFNWIMINLLEYQWFDVPLSIDDTEVMDALYKHSGGLISQIVNLYMYLNLTAVKHRVNEEAAEEDEKTGPLTITSDIVRRVAESYFSLLNDLILKTREKQKDIDDDEELYPVTQREQMEYLYGNLFSKDNEERSRSIRDFMLTAMESKKSDETVEERTLHSLTAFYSGYFNSETKQKIINQAKAALKRKKLDYTEANLGEECRRIAEKRIANHETDRRKGAPKGDPDEEKKYYVSDIANSRNNKEE